MYLRLDSHANYAILIYYPSSYIYRHNLDILITSVITVITLVLRDLFYK